MKYLAIISLLVVIKLVVGFFTGRDGLHNGSSHDGIDPHSKWDRDPHYHATRIDGIKKVIRTINPITIDRIVVLIL